MDGRFSTPRRCDCARILILALVCLAVPAGSYAQEPNYPTSLKLPVIGDTRLTILSPTLLELSLVNTKDRYSAQPQTWNWVDDGGNYVPPDLTSLRVNVAGTDTPVTATGFRRRPLYARWVAWDLRIGNYLYLTLGSPIPQGAMVKVTNNGTLWPTNTDFSALMDPLRANPAIHVNQEGYVPTQPKKGAVGYYLGSLGEMPVPSLNFSVVPVGGGSSVFQGTLNLRQDEGYLYAPKPYQQVYEADFSGLSTPGKYRLVVQGMGASLPFRIDKTVAMDFARTYALGLLHQRSGFNVAMPFTRFTHAADHTAPASVPLDASQFAFTWATIADYASKTNSDNPPQTAPRLTEPSAQLYPYVNPGPVDVSGGHFEAANYSKVCWNGAQIVHVLMFAVDSIPGVSAMDNLGIPESGDGIPDVLQEAKWEADCLAKMQDADGGFYYMIHPREREYEYDVLPENGDPQVVWPKNTASTAAAVAALAQCASSTAFKQAYPQAASNYWSKALLGWKFLTNAIAVHGFDGAYQRIMHFDDNFTHTDDLAWAACELFLATGDSQFRTLLETWFPDPADTSTARWGWWWMNGSYGNAARSYAAGVRSGRVAPAQLDQTYLARCITAISNAGSSNLRWSQENAYGTSFPDSTKRMQDAGWYFSSSQAFDIVVAQEFSPDSAYPDAILRNMNYEAGCNPVNACYITGLGWKRQREVVDQYSANDRRALPKIGVPVGNIQSGFVPTWAYSNELPLLCSPSDGAPTAPYPFYDRWADYWNVTAEASTSDTVRSYVTALWLAAHTPEATRPWRSTNATIVLPSNVVYVAQPVQLNLQVEDTNLTDARIIWEAREMEPEFGGTNCTFIPAVDGPIWLEAEVQWPDGRRAFATNAVTAFAAVLDGPPELRSPQFQAGSFAFTLAGAPDTTWIIQASTNLSNWVNISTNALGQSGVQPVTDAQAQSFGRRYYRAIKGN